MVIGAEERSLVACLGLKGNLVCILNLCCTQTNRNKKLSYHRESAHLTSLYHTVQKAFDMLNSVLTVNREVYLYRARARR